MNKVKKVIKILSYIILFIAFLGLYGRYSINLQEGKNRHTWVGRFVYNLNNFTTTVDEVIQSDEIRNIPPSYTYKFKIDPINKLEKDLFVLNSNYNRDTKEWDINFFNLKNNKVSHKWSVKSDNFKLTDRQFPNAEPRNPIIFPNNDLIVSCDESQNMYRLDKDSKILWENHDYKFHHSLNLDADSNIWACAMNDEIISSPRGKFKFKDDKIIKLDSKTGKVLYKKSLSDVFVENNMPGVIFGHGVYFNTVAESFQHDPLHLNDIEPVLEDGTYWKKDDLFISCRHRSMVFLYRPSTNKILKIVSGPFMAQHDVDILNDSTIAIFNNNSNNTGKFDERAKDSLVKYSWKHSNITTYNFAKDSFSTVHEKAFKEHQIFTYSEGLQHFLSDGRIFVESQNNGLIYVLKDGDVIYKDFIPVDMDGMAERPHWIRIYENINN